MMKNSTLAIFIFCFFLSPLASAGLVDLNLLYSTDSLSTTTSSSANKTFYDFCLGFSVYQKNSIIIGWNYAGYSTSSTASSVTSTYSSTQMGPKFLFYLNKDHNWRLGLAYNIISKATYQNGSSPSESWKGSAYAFDLGYQFQLSEEVFFGARLNYSMSSYNEKLIGTTYTTDTSTQTFIYPSLAVSYMW